MLHIALDGVVFILEDVCVVLRYCMVCRCSVEVESVTHDDGPQQYQRSRLSDNL